MPRTVWMYSGLVGSRSILRRRRLICTSTARSPMALPLPPARSSRVTVSPGAAASRRIISRSRSVRWINSSPRLSSPRLRLKTNSPKRTDSSCGAEAGRSSEQAHHLALAIGEMDQFVAALELAAVEVKDELAETHGFELRRGGRARALENIPDAQRQLARLERLADIVIGAAF